jgi:hypothetical protein
MHRPDHGHFVWRAQREDFDPLFQRALSYLLAFREKAGIGKPDIANENTFSSQKGVHRK